MSNPHFTFPPPPPPPPQTSGDYNRVPQFSSGQRGSHDRGRGVGRGYGDRGRGSNRGGTRGGHASNYGGYPPVDHRRTDGQYGQSSPYGGNYPLPNYPPVQQPQYPANSHSTYNQPHPQHSQQYPYPNSPQPSYSGYSGNGPRFTPVHGAQPPIQAYGHSSPPLRPHQPHPPSSQGQASQPIVMPPIRVGRDGRGGILRTQAAPPNPPAHFNQGPPVHNSYQQPPPTPFQQKRYDAPNPYQNTRGRGHKRGQSDTFKNQRHPRPSGQVAPAVPSFGNPLPGDLSNRPPPQGSTGDGTKKPKKKKRRRHNQLGLTPKAEEHESSSEEEDDQDEEMKLAAAANAASQQIQFEYKGQTSTLNSSSEIDAWIAERKKRFPTKARAEEAAERRKQNEEARRLARQAAKDSQEKRRNEARERQEKQKAEAKEKQKKQNAAAKLKQENSNGPEATPARSDDKEAATLKARLKVEKLRKRLEKEEKRIAKAEAKSSRNHRETKASTDLSNPYQAPTSKKRKRTDSLASSVNGGEKPADAISQTNPTESVHNVDASALLTEVDMMSNEESKIMKGEAIGPINVGNQAPDTAHNPLTPTSQPSIPDIDRSTPHLDLLDDSIEVSAIDADPSGDKAFEEANKADNEPSLSLSDSSSYVSSDSESDLDSTSSSGSSSSSSSDSDAAPEIAPSKFLNPPRVPPPKRQKSKSDKDICRQFLKSGRCPRGEQCKYRHELPEKGNMSRSEKKAEREAKAQATGGKNRQRKGLYQRLVEQEKEEEDRRILTTIIQMGEKGLLSAPSEKKDGGE